MTEQNNENEQQKNTLSEAIKAADKIFGNIEGHKIVSGVTNSNGDGYCRYQIVIATDEVAKRHGK